MSKHTKGKVKVIEKYDGYAIVLTEESTPGSDVIIASGISQGRDGGKADAHHLAKLWNENISTLPILEKLKGEIEAYFEERKYMGIKPHAILDLINNHIKEASK